MAAVMELVWPAMEHLPSYRAALERGWSPDTMRPDASREELERIDADPRLFIAQQVDRAAEGPPVQLRDGTVVPRLPGYSRWLWDGEFCGGIGLRWQPGTTALPPYCLGHVGYSVVPWKRGQGYAKRALALLMEDVAAEGLPFVELCTAIENVASQRVITANGGVLVEQFEKSPHHGSGIGLRWRIDAPPRQA
jgi:predicted acetyltransferase